MKTRYRPRDILGERFFAITAGPSDRLRTDRIVVLIFATAFLATLLVLAVFFPKPTAFQCLVFRVVLAVAAAVVAAHVPGVICIEINSSIRVTGALAVFVIVYFFSPAGISGP